MHLFLETNDYSLRVKNGMFLVRREENNHLLQTEHAPVEVESIWLRTSTLCTVDALRLAEQHGIDVVFTDYHGHPFGRFVPHRPSSTTLTQKAQLIISQTPEAVEWVKLWTADKLQHQQDFLRELFSRRKGVVAERTEQHANGIMKLQRSIEALKGNHVLDIADTLRGLEGTAGRLYFQALSALLPKRYQFEGRSMRPAKDAFNAMLNYGYALLYAKVEAALTRAGVSPWLGFLHVDGYRRQSMVFDFIEPFRHYVERVIVRLCTQKDIVLQSHVETLSDGAVWVSAEGRALLIPILQDQLNEKKFPFRNSRFTVEYAIRWQASRFATRLREQLNQQEGSPLASFALN
jgi:CRISP-associated protein Cas1